MDRFVWVGDETDQDWMRGGSYLVARRIRMLIESWDTDFLADQEQVFGRAKDTGAPLTGTASSTPPDLRGDHGRQAGDRPERAHPAGRAGDQRRAEDPAPRLLLHRRHRPDAPACSTPGCSSSPTRRTRARSSCRSSAGSGSTTRSTSTSGTPAARCSPCRPACPRPATTTARRCSPDRLASYEPSPARRTAARSTCTAWAATRPSFTTNAVDPGAPARRSGCPTRRTGTSLGRRIGVDVPRQPRGVRRLAHRAAHADRRVAARPLGDGRRRARSSPRRSSTAPIGVQEIIHAAAEYGADAGVRRTRYRHGAVHGRVHLARGRREGERRGHALRLHAVAGRTTRTSALSFLARAKRRATRRSWSRSTPAARPASARPATARICRSYKAKELAIVLQRPGVHCRGWRSRPPRTSSPPTAGAADATPATDRTSATDRVPPRALGRPDPRSRASRARTTPAGGRRGHGRVIVRPRWPPGRRRGRSTHCRPSPTRWGAIDVCSTLASAPVRTRSRRWRWARSAVVGRPWVYGLGLGGTDGVGTSCASLRRPDSIGVAGHRSRRSACRLHRLRRDPGPRRRSTRRPTGSASRRSAPAAAGWSCWPRRRSRTGVAAVGVGRPASRGRRGQRAASRPPGPPTCRAPRVLRRPARQRRARGRAGRRRRSTPSPAPRACGRRWPPSTPATPSRWPTRSR